MSDIHIYLEREQPVKVITLEPTGARGPVGPQGPQGPQGPAGPNSVTGSTTSDGTCDLSLQSLTVEPTISNPSAIDITSGSSVGISINTTTGNGISISSTDGVGIEASSQSVNGANLSSNDAFGATVSSYSSTALQLNTVSGNYYVECQNNYTTIEAAIERVRGWFVWFYNTFTGRLKTADITANRDWTLPDQSGTIAVFDDTGSLTVDGILYADHIHGNLAGSVYAHVRAGETLAKGDPVYISGSHGTAPNLIPIVSKADASNSAKMPAIGIMDADLANNASGHMVITGTIADLNTAAYAVNDTLYVASGGGLTATPPAANSQPVARVERSNTNNGALIVKVNGLASSGGNGVSDANKLVRFSSTGGVNFNAGAGTSLVITGNLTVDTNTFFVDSTNNRVGIGTTSPAAGYSLDVTGAIRSTGNLLLQGNIVYLNSQQTLTQGTNSLTLGAATYFTSLSYGNVSTTQHTFNGSGITAATASFTSTTRPTSAGTGEPAATSLITRADGDARFLLKPFIGVITTAVNSDTNTTTYKTVTELQTTLAAGTYLLECQLIHDGNANYATSGVKDRINVVSGSATAAGFVYRVFDNATTATTFPSGRVSTNPLVESAPTNRSQSTLRTGILTVTSTAVIAVQIAQTAAVAASNTTLQVGSYLKITPIS